MPQCIRTLPGLDQFRNYRPILQYCCTKCYWLTNNNVKNVSVTLWFSLQCRCKTFCFVCFYQPALCRVCLCYGLRVCWQKYIHSFITSPWLPDGKPRKEWCFASLLVGIKWKIFQHVCWIFGSRRYRLSRQGSLSLTISCSPFFIYYWRIHQYQSTSLTKRKVTFNQIYKSRSFP